MREGAVAAEAASEQPEGLDILELGLREIELARVHVGVEPEVVAEGDARAWVVEQRLG